MNFRICTLGCKVNTYESNVMRDKLLNAGYTESTTDVADIYIINTCTVTDTSAHKSLKVVRQCIRKNEKAIIVVCGCMTQVEPEKAKIDGVSIILGNKYKSMIVEVLEQYRKTLIPIIQVDDIMECPFEHMVLNNFNRTRAFVKIEDGCENYCSYCIIPYARGNVRSKKPENVINEIKELIKNGHQEIVLAGIHTGHYGSEFKDYDFSDLLNDILKLNGLKRLRISSIEIVELTDKFLNILENNKVLVDHLHIPLQAGSNEVLKLMNRKYDLDFFYNKIKKIRSIRPEISITTDVIVGFPGETVEDVEETIDVIKKVRYDNAFTFIYSRRKGTPADKMEGQIDEETSKNRIRTIS